MHSSREFPPQTQAQERVEPQLEQAALDLNIQHSTFSSA